MPQLTQKKSALIASGASRQVRQTGIRLISIRGSPQTRQSSGKRREKRAREADLTAGKPNVAIAARLLLEKTHLHQSYIVPESEAPWGSMPPRDRRGPYSIRINAQYRLCFEGDNGEAYDVEITDYH